MEKPSQSLQNSNKCLPILLYDDFFMIFFIHFITPLLQFGYNVEGWYQAFGNNVTLQNNIPRHPLTKYTQLISLCENCSPALSAIHARLPDDATEGHHVRGLLAMDELWPQSSSPSWKKEEKYRSAVQRPPPSTTELQWWIITISCEIAFRISSHPGLVTRKYLPMKLNV